MLNEFTKSELYFLLSDFDDDSLFSLTATVTQGLSKNKINSREEAINAIINYSPDAVSILKRKIVTREILFNYTHKRNLSIPLPASKTDLIERILAYWNSTASISNHHQETFNQNNHQANKTPEYNNTSSENTIRLLAEQFSEWFYSMMNKNECIASSHFYNDAKLKINILGNGELQTEIIENDPNRIVQQLFMTKMNFNLLFNPNLTQQGVQGRIDPHGLVMVLACGTLHVNDACMGVFEQVFGLVRDPSADNNWKIKSTELNLKSLSGVLAQPTLCDSELTASLLSLPTS